MLCIDVFTVKYSIPDTGYSMVSGFNVVIFERTTKRGNNIVLKLINLRTVVVIELLSTRHQLVCIKC